MLRGKLLVLATLAWASVPQLFAQPPAKPNRLLTAKLVYVKPMPQNLDQWIIEDLKAWNRYQISADPEGVDIEVHAVSEQQPMPRITVRQGIPQPQLGKKNKRLPILSIAIEDWSTTKYLWHADILDKKLKSSDPPPPLGPETKIYAKGMTPDELAAAIVRRFRQYVTQLQSTPGGSQQ
jgi:hypothetical protein